MSREVPFDVVVASSLVRLNKLFLCHSSTSMNLKTSTKTHKKTVRRATVDDRKKLIDSVDAFIFDCDGERF